MNTRLIVAEAAALLRQARPGDWRLADPLLLSDRGRNWVLRCRVEPACDGHSTVIVKQRRPDADARLLQTEWACLALLADLPGAGGLAPGLLAGDPQRGLLVLADLGDGGTLDDVLRGRDRDLLDRSLATLARSTARLHTLTHDRETAFDALCRRVPGLDTLARLAEAERWRAALPRALAWLDALGLAAPPDLTATIDYLANLYVNPADMLALSHGDPAPSNNRLIGNGVALLDFEYGAFRHALYDITAWHILCPLPSPCVDLVSREFQSELATALPAAADPERYRAGWAALCAYRGLAMLGWLPPSALEADRPWVERWSARRAAVATCARLHAATSDDPKLAPVAELALRLERGLRRRWPEIEAEPIPQWPVFGADA
ncbi:MAG TPA: hypothetical protein VFS21_22840 [Roseiflexaceae bacterium]|nr:hypothetical protein [Roseiflexaceae bacterium]